MRTDPVNLYINEYFSNYLRLAFKSKTKLQFENELILIYLEYLRYYLVLIVMKY